MEHYKNLDLSDIKYFCEFDQIWKIEQWKDVVGYEDHYMISDLGRVKSIFNKKIILTQRKASTGYLRVNFSVSGIHSTKLIHSLVCIAFLDHNPCGYKFVVNHKDNIKQNNKLSNLEVVTQRENVAHGLGFMNKSSKFIGVSFHKKSGKFQARIYIKPNDVHLGLFDTEEDASKAYNNALKKNKP